MRCRVCGGELESRITDLPFKVGDSSIVILKSRFRCFSAANAVKLNWSRRRCCGLINSWQQWTSLRNWKSSGTPPELNLGHRQLGCRITLHNSSSDSPQPQHALVGSLDFFADDAANRDSQRLARQFHTVPQDLLHQLGCAFAGTYHPENAEAAVKMTGERLI